MRNHTALALVMLLCGAWAIPATATVVMEVRDLPGSLGFSNTFFVSGSTPVSLSESHGDGFASGSVSYDSLGLQASIQTDTDYNTQTRFGVWAILRYDDLEIASDDGADFVSGVVNLVFDGSSVLETSDMNRNSVAYSINPGVSTASGGNAATVSRTVSVFGDDSVSNGFLAGYDGNGSISVSVPVVFSTTTPEFLQIEIRIVVDAFVRAGESATLDVDFADTVSFADPAELVTFTSGLNPTLDSSTGEIVDNALAIPEPAALALLLLGCAGLYPGQRRGARRASAGSPHPAGMR